MSIAENLKEIKAKLGDEVELIAVSKTHPNDLILEAYEAGQRHFGENKVQEMTAKAEELPKDIHWHLIGHLQRNKVKYIVDFVYMIHSVDSLKLLREINKRAGKANRVVDCLLQVHIAEEDSKFGLDRSEVDEILKPDVLSELNNIRIKGLMGMATFTEDEEQVKREFRGLKQLFESLKQEFAADERWQPEVLSMGMSGDWQLAIQEGSNMVRIGSSIFGARDYSN